MKITNSLDWFTVHSELKGQIQKLPYDPALRQMLKNIDGMIADLSKAEVEARRTKVFYYTADKLTKINESIDNLEKFILMGALLM